MAEDVRSIISKEITFKVIGMHCASCVLTVKKAIESVDGVKEAKVNLATNEASVRLGERQLDYKKLLEAVRKVGYDIYKEDVVFTLKSIEVGDEKEVINILRRNGVFSIRVNPILKQIIVTINPLETSERELRELLRENGFEVVSSSKEVGDVERKVLEVDIKDFRKRLFLSIPLSLIILSLMALHIQGILSTALYNISSLIFATPIQFYSGSRFLRGALRAMRNRNANMDTLIALGTMSTYLFSFLIVIGLISGETYFDSSALIITAVLLGRYLEAKARLSVLGLIKSLEKVIPEKCVKIDQGEEVEVNSWDLRTGDKVLVKQGYKVPCDGIVDEGYGILDESIITGESKPVEKKAGEVAIAGSILLSGYLVVRATRIGKDTLINQIMREVKIGQSMKLPIQSLIDRISGMFSWFVIIVALLTFLLWFAISSNTTASIIHMASVLVISCPCALGLASPLSIVIGLGKSAEMGIIIRRPEVIEKINKASIFAFDKTGTITRGKPEVISVFGEKTLELASIAEVNVDHPYSKAIVEQAKIRGIKLLKPTSFDYIQGAGVIAYLDDKTIGVGNEKIVQGLMGNINSDLEEISKKEREKGNTVIYVVENNNVIGLITIGDKIKEEAREIISYLKLNGKRVIMLTGDNELTARAVAKEVGIDEVYSSLSPEGKAEIINEMKKKGMTVMMGDGINDSIALSSADIGIAMGRGSEIAKQSGDVILLRDNLYQLIELIKISKKILNNIKFNLLYAFGYNVILIPVAAGIFGFTLRPEIAGIAMALSSLSVTLNALRLKNTRMRKGVSAEQ